jgi:hypothetical protein
MQRLAAAVADGVFRLGSRVLSPDTKLALGGGVLAGLASLFVARQNLYWIFSETSTNRFLPLASSLLIVLGSFLLVSRGVDLLIRLSVSAQTVALKILIGAAYVLGGSVLMLASWPQTEPRTVTTGGIAIFTTNIETLGTTITDRSSDYSDPGRIVGMSIRGTTGGGEVNLALVSSGDMQIETLSIASGLIMPTSFESSEDEKVFDYIADNVTPESTTAPLLSPESGKVAIDRLFPSQLVRADWYQSDSVRVYLLPLGKAVGGGALQVDLIVRTRGQFSREGEGSSSGSLGQIGCGSNLVDRSANFNDGEGLKSLVRIPVRGKQVSWAVPRKCTMNLELGEVRGDAELTVAGESVEDKRITLQGVSNYPDGPRYVTEYSDLTVPNTSWTMVQSGADVKIRDFLSGLWVPTGLALSIAGVVTILNTLLVRTGLELPGP